MRTRFIYSFLLLIALFVLSLGCGKDNERDCELKNYGTVTVHFSTGLSLHSILITYPDFTFREKMVSIGSTQDTVRLAPASYVLSISSLDILGQSVDNELKAVTTTQCSEETINVAF